MTDFLMPALGADMETGKVIQWHVQAGDRVRRGDVVAVVETHKGAIDVEIFLDGVIEDLAPLDQPLPVGAVLARVRTAQDPVAEPIHARARPQALPTPSPGPVSPPVVVTVLSAGRVRASPLARRRAAQRGLDLAGLQGTGIQGAVTLTDVERAPGAPDASAPVGPPSDQQGHAESVVPAALPRRGFDLAQMRQAIAAAMGRSKREIPHYYLGSTLDFEVAARWLEATNRERDPERRLLPAVLLLKATALALRQVPQLNGFHEAGGFRPGAGIHVGWAVALRGGGLVAPAIHDADGKSLDELMADLRDLVQRARAGGLRSSELTDPTITVTSLGERGAESVLGVIYPPQVAIVGFGRMVERPWVVDGQVLPRRLVQASLAADHRVSDGHIGGQLLHAIGLALQQPQQL